MSMGPGGRFPKKGRFYPNLTGKIDADAEQSIYRLFDNVYQLRTSLRNFARAQAAEPAPLTLEDIRKALESPGSHPINVINLPGLPEEATPHLWEELQVGGTGQVWLSPNNVEEPTQEAKVIVGADLPVGVNGSLIPDVTATTGFRSQTGMAFNLGVFNALGNFARAIDTKWSNAFIGAFATGVGNATIRTKNLTLWDADHVGTSAIGFVSFSSATNPGNIQVNVNNACSGALCGAMLSVSNAGSVQWTMGMNGGTSQATSTFCISSRPATNNPCSNAVITISGATNLVTIVNDLSVGGDITGFSSLDNIQFNFTGAFASGGVSNFATKIQLNSSVTGFAGDTAFITGVNLDADVTTQGGAEVIAEVAQLRLGEPNITLVGGSTVTLAATLLVLDAPTEGGTNYAIRVNSGLTSVDDFEHFGTLIGFFGTAPVVQAPAYTVTNHTVDRTYDANAGGSLVARVNELADVLGTVILDLINYGLLQGSVT